MKINLSDSKIYLSRMSVKIFTLLRSHSYRTKANAEAKKIKEPAISSYHIIISKEIKEKISNIRENFRFRFCFFSVWMDLNCLRNESRLKTVSLLSLILNRRQKRIYSHLRYLRSVHTKKKRELKRFRSKIGFISIFTHCVPFWSNMAFTQCEYN